MIAIPNFKSLLPLMASLWQPRSGSLSAKQARLQNELESLITQQAAFQITLERLDTKITSVAKDTQTIIKLLQEGK